MSCILVTGANGFVGSKLCQVLIDNSDTVHAITRCRDFPLETTALKHFSVINIGSDTQWESALDKVDCVIHLAARVHVMSDSSSNPLAIYREVNTAGTMNLARQALKAGVKRFIYISSIKVNGESTSKNTSFKASDEPFPTDPYAISKYEAEQQLFELTKGTDMGIVVIRPPLVYGPGVKANFLTMMRWVNKEIPLPLGFIQNKRSLVALDNLVDLIVVCSMHKAAVNEVFLVSDGNDLSVTQLLHTMAKALDKSSRLIPVPVWLIRLGATILRQNNTSKRLLGSLQVDIRKTQELLNWEPSITAEEALKETANHFIKNL
ncbi:SDR family oxidoreductase [bacterium]|nr:SDR family oxidoreductase [bacterium]